MACFAATLVVIILSGFINPSAAKTDTCDLYAAIGQSLSLPFVYEGLTTYHVLRWTHNSSIIFYRQQGRVSVGKSGDVSSTGSLSLKNLQPSSAGTYQANLLHPNGTFIKTWSSRLCLMDKVSKPKLTYSCDFKSSSVKLNCEVAKPQGWVFSWTLDDKTLPSESRQALSFSLAQLKGERSFTCSVENKVSKERSDTVRPSCKTPAPSQATQFCFKPSTIVAVLAGAVCLILVLLTMVIALCCCKKRNNAQMRTKGAGDLRMLSLNKQEPDSISPEYETMHPSEDSPPPSPEPSARECYKNVSQPEAQTENRLPQLPAEAEGLKPSPVPKPRMKSPQTQNI
uniref:T-cell surface antigen CD2-like n=1 Tax=Semicossyphus pulcher TaxID=241346 RepID=UPI0037E86065